MKKRHRIFIAINLPNNIKKQLNLYKDKWQDIPAKWTNLDNMHITLEFLGDITSEELVEVCMAVKEVASKYKSFSINLNKIIYGPPQKMPPKIVWVKGEKSDELAELKHDLQEYLLEKVSYRPESREFTPHITLARINEWQFKSIEPEERPEINEYIDFIIPVESIEVMESELKRGRLVYTILESHNLLNY